MKLSCCENSTTANITEITGIAAEGLVKAMVPTQLLDSTTLAVAIMQKLERKQKQAGN